MLFLVEFDFGATAFLFLLFFVMFCYYNSVISNFRVVVGVAVTVGVDGQPVVGHLEEFPVGMVAGEDKEGHNPEHGDGNPQRPQAPYGITLIQLQRQPDGEEHLGPVDNHIGEQLAFGRDDVEQEVEADGNWDGDCGGEDGSAKGFGALVFYAHNHGQQQHGEEDHLHVLPAGLADGEEMAEEVAHRVADLQMMGEMHGCAHKPDEEGKDDIVQSFHLYCFLNYYNVASINCLFFCLLVRPDAAQLLEENRKICAAVV